MPLCSHYAYCSVSPLGPSYLFVVMLGVGILSAEACNDFTVYVKVHTCGAVVYSVGVTGIWFSVPDANVEKSLFFLTKRYGKLS